jgi:hypothetical protein
MHRVHNQEITDRVTTALPMTEVRVIHAGYDCRVGLTRVHMLAARGLAAQAMSILTREHINVGRSMEDRFIPESFVIWTCAHLKYAVRFIYQSNIRDGK